MSLVKINQRLQSIDVTKLVAYTKKISEMAGLNPMMAPVFLRDFIMAYDVTNMMLSAAVRCELDAKSELEKSKAIAYLDKSGDYLTEKGIKISSAAREQYIEIDTDVIGAREAHAKSLAMVTFLKNKLQTFRLAHDTLKKISYSDGHQTGYEGA